jgi:DNA repair exonuclease SbcCD nuclease subunit
MTAPYLIVSDLHFHNWSAFATADATGMNSRLRIQLDELLRAADELKKRGGERMFYAGDLFHVRGSIDPEVFNPTHRVIQSILDKNITQWAIPGNHDLKGRDTTELGNSFQSMKGLKSSTILGREFQVITEPDVVSRGPNIAMLPWCADKDKLRTAVKLLMNELDGAEKDTDLIIHAGIDGVLDGVPPAGLNSAEVASWGFNRVFAGDYHNHKVMESGKVISIGAMTHNTWSDIGSKAGFLFVYPDRVEYQASHAPSFVEVSGEDDPKDIPLIVDGNYVRVRSMKLSDAEIKTFRKELEEMGARAVSFQVAREAVVARAGSVTGKASTLDESVDKFIDTLPEIDTVAVKAQCTDVLNQVRSVAA